MAGESEEVGKASEKIWGGEKRWDSNKNVKKKKLGDSITL